MLDLVDTISVGFPKQEVDWTDGTQPYSNLERDLNVFDGVVLYAGRVVIPLALIQEILTALHHGQSQCCKHGVTCHQVNILANHGGVHH
jgi:hypothetical protein